MLKEIHLKKDSSLVLTTSPLQFVYHKDISKDADLRAYWNYVKLDFSRPGKPTDNAYIESLSFNAWFRLECLNEHWFMSLEDAREKTEEFAAQNVLENASSNRDFEAAKKDLHIQ